MQGQRIGYVRVSSFDQNPERQLEGVQVARVFTDKASGKDTQRPELERLLAFVRESDTVVVHNCVNASRAAASITWGARGGGVQVKPLTAEQINKK